MEAKEGIVLDREDRGGKPLFTPTEAGKDESEGTGAPRPSGIKGAYANIRVYRGGWWLPIVLGVGIPLLFFAGIFIFTVLMTVGIAVVLLRSLLGGGAKNTRGR
jgi:hypothetical protein